MNIVQIKQKQNIYMLRQMDFMKNLTVFRVCPVQQGRPSAHAIPNQQIHIHNIS